MPASGNAPTASDPDSAPPRHPVSSLAIFFFLAGFLMSNWTVRIPAVKDQVDASATALGLALLCQSLGGLVSMPVGSRLCLRFGPRPVVLVAAPLTCLGVVLPTLAGSRVALGAGLLVLGLLYGTYNISLNNAGVETEKVLGRSVMPTLHGLFSGGALGGAVVGGFAAAHLSPTTHVGTTATVALLTVGICARSLRRALDTETAPATPATTRTGLGGFGRSGLPAVTFVFAIIAFCSAFGEFSAIDWATLHLQQDLTATATAAAWGLACYEGAMTTGRLVGSKLVGRFGETGVLGGGALLALTGGLIAAWAGVLPGTGGLLAAYTGYLMFGLGMANIFPIAIARSGAIGGPIAVSRTAMASTIGILAERPIIGFLADHVGLPGALSLIAILVASIAVLGILARTPGRQPTRVSAP